MKKIKYIYVFLLVPFISLSQDIHWSQFDYNPVFQNPANVGQFDGDYRFYGNYRNQWRSISTPFQTFSVSGEAKQIFQNINFGVLFFRDAAGDGKFSTIELQPSISSNFKLTSDSTHLLRAGIQLGLNFRSLNPSSFQFGSQWDGQMFDENLPSNENFHSTSVTNFTFGLGLGYEQYKNERNRMVIGMGLFNLNRPNQGFFGAEVRRDMRFNLFLNAEYKIGMDWDLLPSFQFNLQGKYQEIILGSQARYIIINRLGVYRAVLGGVFIRNGDAVVLSGGVEYQSVWTGVSYDINYSSLTPASRGRGGFEFSFRYTLHHFKPKFIKYRICPDYI